MTVRAAMLTAPTAPRPAMPTATTLFGGPPIGGEFIMAIDPSHFGDADHWAQHCEALFDELTAMEGVRLPGQRRRKARTETPTTGIVLPRSLVDTINGLAG